MFIKSLTLTDYKQYKGTHHFNLSNLVYLRGNNGVGKTNFLSAILFLLNGYVEAGKVLADVPTTGCAVTEVSGVIEHKGHVYEITRRYPTKITIKEDGKLRTDTEPQKFLNDTFRDVDYFRKFRMIDTKKGINFLEQGDTEIRKTLLSLSQGAFNNIRVRLTTRKTDKDKLNRDKLVTVKCYPSDKRYAKLKEGYDSLDKKVRAVQSELDAAQREYNAKDREIASLESEKVYYTRQKNSLQNGAICSACKQPLPKDKVEGQIQEAITKLSGIDEKIAQMKKNVDLDGDLISEIRTDMDSIRKDKERIYKYLIKLENRLKQKQFVYTNKDVLITAQAIKELDLIQNDYIVKWLEQLEPVVNQVIQKIHYSVKIKLDEKGNLKIEMTKDNGLKYKYEQLSDGQKLVLSIAFKLALLLQKNDEGLLVADEGFSSLDEENLNHIFTLFESLPFQLIAVVHRLNNVPTKMQIIDLNVLLAEKK
jgi:DNA repair exonuclease SbcCD ATPase subunit